MNGELNTLILISNQKGSPQNQASGYPLNPNGNTLQEVAAPNPCFHGVIITCEIRKALLANFKPGRGNYAEDGGFYTVRTDAYWPNDYGLYCMAGNVAEWTSSLFTEGPASFYHDMNPDIRYDARLADPPFMKRKTIRGGSWKDVGYYLQSGTRSYEYKDSSKSYIGFRCVIDRSK